MPHGINSRLILYPHRGDAKRECPSRILSLYCYRECTGLAEDMDQSAKGPKPRPLGCSVLEPNITFRILYDTMTGKFLMFVPHVLEAWHTSPQIAWPTLWKSAGLQHAARVHMQNNFGLKDMTNSSYFQL